jgi:hypothetical protein
MTRWLTALAMTVLLLSGCTTEQIASCCPLLTSTSDHSVAGKIGERVSVTWPAGSGTVTINQIKWTHPTDDPTGALLMLDVTYEATSGTVQYGRTHWQANDAAAGMPWAADMTMFDDPSLQPLPEAGTLQAGEKVRGWTSSLMVGPPKGVIEVRLLEVTPSTWTQFASWVIQPPATKESSPETTAISTPVTR